MSLELNTWFDFGINALIMKLLVKRILAIFILFYGISSCKKNAEGITPISSGTDSKDIVSKLEEKELPSDYVWDILEAKSIILNENTASTTASGVLVNGNIIKITKAGTYNIKGKLNNGQIVVDTDDKDLVRLVLNGVDISYSESSSLFLDNAEKVILILADGTINRFSDGSTSFRDTTEGQNATIYSQTYTAIAGTGTLMVNSKFADGITGKDGLVINDGKITINATDDGIRGKDFLVIRNGDMNITCGGDALKSDNDKNLKAGYVSIENGEYKLSTRGDGISAFSSVLIKGGEFEIFSGGGNNAVLPVGLSAKGIKAKKDVSIQAKKMILDCADDAIHSDGRLQILGGIYDISCGDDAIHADNLLNVEKSEVLIKTAFEGFEAKTINIGAGKFELNTYNDCISASAGNDAQQNDGSYVYIKNGTIILRSTAGDLLDSNGNIEMGGGIMIMHGPISAEVPIDYNGTFKVISGIIVASGSNSRFLQAPSSISVQNSVQINFKSSNSAGDLINISNTNGESLVTFRPKVNYFTFIFSSAKLAMGATFKVSTGGTIEGEEIGGYYPSGSYKNGAVKGAFTKNSVISQVSI